MPQITNVRIMRFRKVQPEQFGGAGAEVELHATVLEGEDYRDITRGLLFDARAMVYENLGMKLPASAFKEAEAADKPRVEKPATTKASKEPETQTEEEIPGGDVDTEAVTEEKPKSRGRPKGSKNTRPKKGTKAAEEAVTEAVTVGEDEIPGEDNSNESPKDQISTNPEDRVDPDAIPGEEETVEAEETKTAEPEMDGVTFNTYINDSIRAGKLTGIQAKEMMKAMKIARVRDLETPERLAEAKMMIDTFIDSNSKGK